MQVCPIFGQVTKKMVVYKCDQWQSRVRRMRLLYSGSKPTQTGNPFVSHHVWMVPLLVTAWSAAMMTIVILALHMRVTGETVNVDASNYTATPQLDTLQPGKLEDSGQVVVLWDMNLMALLHLPMMVIWGILARRQYREHTTSCHHHYHCKDNCSLCKRRHQQRRAEVQASTLILMLALLVQILKCARIFIPVLLILLSGDVERNPGPTFDLVLANLPKLCNLLADASPEWMDLGLQLGVDQATLRIIRQDNHHVIEDCFTDMLSEWLKMIDPLPSWEGLIAALESPSVNQKDLASVVMNELGIPVETEDAQGKGNIPTLDDLICMGVAEKISDQWFRLGIRVGIDPAMLDHYRLITVLDNNKCIERVFQHWIDSGGSPHYPVTWRGVYDVLNDIDCNAIAEDIAKRLSQEGISIGAPSPSAGSHLSGSKPAIVDLEHLGLFQQISSEWITLGECLGISAPALNVLQTKYMFSSYTSCVMVFQRWINNDGFPSHYPVTWQGLYDVLFDIHMGRIAMEMKEKLSMEELTKVVSTTSLNPSSMNTGHRPIITLYFLKLLGVYDKIGSEWFRLGICLGISPTDLSNFKIKAVHDNGVCCELVFQHWIDHGGSPHYPLTWQGVYDALCDIGHAATAKKAKEELLKKGMVVGAGATHSSGNEISSTPTVMDLEYLGVIQWISNEWQTLGMHLLVPPATLTSFFQKSMFDTYECCVMVFQHWIDCGGTSDYPPTWQGVCDVLCDIEHVAIAKKLKDKLSMKGKEQWEHFDAYQKAIEEGDFVPMQYLKCYLVGIPGVGKTTTMRRLVKMPTEDFSESTTFKSHPMKAATTGIDSTESDVSCSNSESEISDDGIHSDDSDSTEEVHQKLREKTDVKVEQSIISITNCAMSLAKNELWDIIELYHCTHRSKVSSDSHEVPQQSIADNESAENSATNGRSPSAPSARDLPEIPVVANWKEVEDIISSEVPEDIRKIVNEFNKQLKEKGGQFSSSKDVQLMLMIDIGGQSAFLEMLPLLMKGPSIYLTFFKLSEDPFKDRYSDEFRVDQNTTCDKDIKSVWTVGDVIVQILSNVAMSRYPNKEVGSLMQKLQIDASDAATSTPADPSEHAYEHQACAFLIGTFKDKLKESLAGDKRLLTKRLREINKSIEKAIRDIFGDFKNRFIAYRDLSRSKLIFTLDKFSGDKEMKELRSCLMKESEKMRNFRVPVRWLIFGLILRKEYDWITVEDCEHVAEELHIKRKDVKEVLYFLSSITGMLLYQPEIDDPALQNVVICNLQVIFTSISERIVGNVYGEFGKQKPRREYVKDIGRGKFLRNEEKEEGNSLEKSKRRPLDEESGVEPIPIDSLLRLLSYRNIIAPLSKCEYIMPAALDYCYTPKDIIDDLKKKYPCSNTLPCPLFIKFAIGCTPPGLFSCLITTLYKKVKDDVQNLVKRNFICFEEGGAMIALVACSRWYEVHVINYDFEIVDDLKQLCVLVKKTVLIPIKKVVGRLGFSEQSTPCQLKLYIKCWLQPDDPEHFIELEEKKSKIRECFYLRCESCRENIHDSCWISPNVTPKSSNGKESLCFGKPTLEVLSHHGVISKVHEKWHELGVEFGQGDYLEGYKAKALMNYHTCCTYVFKAWIDNDGTEKYPLTWQGVYNALKSIGHDGIAKKVLSDMNIPFNP